MSRALRSLAVVASACGLVVAFCPVAGAAPADLDRSFGREGAVMLDSTSLQYATPDDVAVGAKGEIYALRTVQRCPTYASCVVELRVDRVQPGGDPEAGEWANGVSLPIWGDLYEEESSIAVDPEGRVVIAAPTRSGSLALARLNPDGTLDNGFGTAGIAEFNLGEPVDRARLALTADSRPVVVAEPLSGYGGDAVIVARFTALGKVDPTFDGGSPFVTTLGSGFGGFGLTDNGGIAIAGPRCCSALGNAVHVTALDWTGSLDSGFGHDGQLFVDDVTRGVGVGAVVVLPKGAIYVIGSSGNRSGNAFALRLMPDGRLDRGFGHRGIAYIGHSYLNVRDAMVDRAGRLLVVGSSPARSARGFRSAPFSLTLLRLSENGRRDRTFAGGSPAHIGSRGRVWVVGAGLQEGRGIILLTRGGSCSRTCQSPDSVLMRFIGGSSGARCHGKRATIVGTREDDELVGTRRSDVIVSLAGDDVVRGRGGDDVICGGRGNDKLIGGPGRDVLRGGAGHNRLHQ